MEVFLTVCALNLIVWLVCDYVEYKRQREA